MGFSTSHLNLSCLSSAAIAAFLSVTRQSNASPFLLGTHGPNVQPPRFANSNSKSSHHSRMSVASYSWAVLSWQFLTFAVPRNAFSACSVRVTCVRSSGFAVVVNLLRTTSWCWAQSCLHTDLIFINFRYKNCWFLFLSAITFDFLTAWLKDLSRGLPTFNRTFNFIDELDGTASTGTPAIR